MPAHARLVVAQARRRWPRLVTGRFGGQRCRWFISLDAHLSRRTRRKGTGVQSRDVWRIGFGVTAAMVSGPAAGFQAQQYGQGCHVSALLRSS